VSATIGDKLPVNAHTEQKSATSSSMHFAGLLTLLIGCAMLLVARLVYLTIADPLRFPINTVKIEASYQHISRKELETVLAPNLEASFFSFAVTKLQNTLNALEWVDSALVERIWPDTVHITLVEKEPVARFGDKLLTEKGQAFNRGDNYSGSELPLLKGPETQIARLLQVYKKLGKILSDYGLHASELQLRENQAWVVTLDTGVKLYLGKKAMALRLLRFCKAYPAVFAEKIEWLASVDMRYPRGMAVRWKQQTEQ
jgi:cell division protein FtsQ